MNFSKKIICCFILMILYFKSYGQWNKTKLTDYVIQELNITINEEYTYTNESIIPYDKNHSIILIANPVVFEDGDQLIEYDSYIVIINNKTKKIKHRFFESHKTNGWISDAIPISSFGFDFSIPPLNNSDKPFGIVIHRSKPGGATQYFGSNLTVLISENDTLKVVLKNYEMSHHFSEIGRNCYSRNVETQKELEVTPEKSKGLYNLTIKCKIIETVYEGIDENGDCITKTKKDQKEEEIFKFNGEIYFTEK